MRYLFCDKCERYHELQVGESPENYSDQCECGGKLEYVDYSGEDEFPNIEKNSNPPKDDKGIPILMIFFSAICVYGGNLIGNFTITTLGIIGIIFALILLIILIKGLIKTMNVRYLQLIYLTSAILFLALSISLFIILFQDYNNIRSLKGHVHTDIKRLGTFVIIIFLSLLYSVNMILKTMNPYKHTIFDPKY